MCPRPRSTVELAKRTYILPRALLEWIDRVHLDYRMRDGKPSRHRVDVVRDALERIRDDEQTYAIAARSLAGTPRHHNGLSGEPMTYKLPAELVAWVELHYRVHRMLDGSRASTHTDLVVDALERARRRDRQTGEGRK
jgi:hypothetical protein